jgi:hypothetical protein
VFLCVGVFVSECVFVCAYIHPHIHTHTHSHKTRTHTHDAPTHSRACAWGNPTTLVPLSDRPLCPLDLVFTNALKTDYKHDVQRVWASFTTHAVAPLTTHRGSARADDGSAGSAGVGPGGSSFSSWHYVFGSHLDEDVNVYPSDLLSTSTGSGSGSGSSSGSSSSSSPAAATGSIGAIVSDASASSSYMAVAIVQTLSDWPASAQGNVVSAQLVDASHPLVLPAATGPTPPGPSPSPSPPFKCTNNTSRYW